MVARSPRYWFVLATFNCVLIQWMVSIGWAADAPNNIHEPAAAYAPSQAPTPPAPPAPDESPAGTVTSASQARLQLDGKEFRLSGPYRHENLAVYFVHARLDDDRAFITLDEGLRKKLVTVREKDGGGERSDAEAGRDAAAETVAQERA